MSIFTIVCLALAVTVNVASAVYSIKLANKYRTLIAEETARRVMGTKRGAITMHWDGSKVVFKDENGNVVICSDPQ